LGDVVINSNNSGEQKLTIGDTNDYGKIEFLRNGPNYIDAKATAGSLIIRTGASPTQTVEFNEDQSTVFAGKVGIGATTVDTILHIEAADPVLKLQDSSSNGNAAIAYVTFRSADDTEMGFVGDGSPGDDDIYLQAATGDLRLMANGSITTNARLKVTGSESGTNVLAGSGDAGIQLRNSNATDNTHAAIDFHNNSDYMTAKIGALFKDTSDRDTDLFFATRADGGNLTERMRIDSTGKVGIGITSPTTLLELNGANASYSNIARFFNSDVSAGHVNMWLGKASASQQAMSWGYYYHGTAANRYAWFGLHYGDSPGTHTLNIIQGGSVGIGATNPVARLHIGTGSGDSLIWSSDNSGNYRSAIYNTWSSSSTANNKLQIKVGNTSTTGMTTVATFEGSGNVGIGTTSPKGIVDIRAANETTFDAAKGLVVSNHADASGTFAGVAYSLRSASPAKAWIGLIYSSGYGRGDLVFLNDNASNDYNVSLGDEVMRITHEGEVGIGTTAPDSRLWIQDTGGTAASGLTIANSASHNWSIYRHNVRGGALAIEGEGTAPGVAIITANPVLTIANTTTAAVGVLSKIKFEFKDSSGNLPSTVNPSAEIRATVIAYDGNEATASLSFHTQNPLAISPEGLTQKMVIMDSGKVGIGTTAPTELFQVAASASSSSRIRVSTFSTTDTHQSNIQFTKSGSNVINTLVATADDEGLGYMSWMSVNNAGTPAESQSAYILVAQDAGTSARPAARMEFAVSDGTNIGPKVTILSNGRVGIGITPTAQLHVEGPGSSTDLFTLKMEGGSGKQIDITADNSGVYMDYTGYLYIRPASSTAKSIQLNASTGQVVLMNNTLSGAITSAPQLHLNSGAVGSNNQWASIKFSGSTSYSNENWYIGAYGHASDNGLRRFSIANHAGTEVFTVNYNGNVGIGTTAPDHLLHVEDSSPFSLTATP